MENTATDTKPTLLIDGTAYVVEDRSTAASMAATMPNLAAEMIRNGITATVTVRRPKGQIWWQYYERETARGPRYQRICRVYG